LSIVTPDHSWLIAVRLLFAVRFFDLFERIELVGDWFPPRGVFAKFEIFLFIVKESAGLLLCFLEVGEFLSVAEGERASACSLSFSKK